jgi:hypothetical protein
VDILRIIFICGIIYGLTSFFITLNRRPKDKNKLTLAGSLIIVCGASFFMLND